MSKTKEYLMSKEEAEFERAWTEMEAKYDKQVGGNHYASMAITPTEYVLANNIEWLEANVVKYVSRHQNKNGLEDIEKAIHYLELIKKHKYGRDNE